jgi:hypothetical protein
MEGELNPHIILENTLDFVNSDYKGYLLGSVCMHLQWIMNNKQSLVERGKVFLLILYLEQCAAANNLFSNKHNKNIRRICIFKALQVGLCL